MVLGGGTGCSFSALDPGRAAEGGVGGPRGRSCMLSALKPDLPSAVHPTPPQLPSSSALT